KYLLIPTLILLIFQLANAQKIEIFGAYSYGSEIGKLMNSTPSLPDEIGSMYIRDHNSKSTFTIGANICVFRGFSVGASWTNNGSTVRWMNYLHHSSSSLNYFNQSSSALLFSAKYDWFKFRKLNFYSRAGIGAVFYNTPKLHSGRNYQFEDFTWSNGVPKSCTRFAWQVSFVGVEYRPIKWIGIFAEGGLGRQGALLAGLKVFI
ncbi:MAG: hypothetical protein K2O43_05660, partial [Muribaculaceae bacterium]|nr:hypothetical protein [Muribaculaceae bacterium]